jgi:hypothetical protein
MADSKTARRGSSLAWTPGSKTERDYTAGLSTLSLLKPNAALRLPNAP